MRVPFRKLDPEEAHAWMEDIRARASLNIPDALESADKLITRILVEHGYALTAKAYDRITLLRAPLFDMEGK